MQQIIYLLNFINILCLFLQKLFSLSLSILFVHGDKSEGKKKKNDHSRIKTPRVRTCNKRASNVTVEITAGEMWKRGCNLIEKNEHRQDVRTRARNRGMNFKNNYVHREKTMRSFTEISCSSF